MCADHEICARIHESMCDAFLHLVRRLLPLDAPVHIGDDIVRLLLRRLHFLRELCTAIIGRKHAGRIRACRPVRLRIYTRRADKCKRPPVQLDDVRLPCLRKVLSGTHVTDPCMVQRVDRIEHRVTPIVKRMIVCERNEVDPHLLHQLHLLRMHTKGELLVRCRRSTRTERELFIRHKKIRRLNLRLVVL